MSRFSHDTFMMLIAFGFSTATPTPTPPRTPSPQLSAAPGPSQRLTALLARLPDANNRSMIDQATIDFAYLNSKASRNRLVKVSHVKEVRSSHVLIIGTSFWGKFLKTGQIYCHIMRDSLLF